jgi:hypothetical protein
VVSTTPRPLYPRERHGTHCKEGWVGPRAGLDVCEKSHPNGIRSPDRPARSQSLYRLSYPAHSGKAYDSHFKGLVPSRVPTIITFLRLCNTKAPLDRLPDASSLRDRVNPFLPLTPRNHIHGWNSSSVSKFDRRQYDLTLTVNGPSSRAV